MLDKALEMQIIEMTPEELHQRTIEMRTGETKMRREGCYWSEEEDALVLYKFYHLFKSTTEIAIEHERQESAIIQRIGILDAQRHGLLKRPNQKKKPEIPCECLCKYCKLDRSLCHVCPHYLTIREDA